MMTINKNRSAQNIGVISQIY